MTLFFLPGSNLGGSIMSVMGWYPSWNWKGLFVYYFMSFASKF